MRVPTRSEGTRSGVHWMRAKVPPRTPAVVLIVRVFASPGTPSIRRWPWAKRQTRTRSSIASCPAITRLISKSACSRRSLASVGEGTARSLCCSVTSAPSVACTESYTTARQPKFLLREKTAPRCRTGAEAVAFGHDEIPCRAAVSCRGGRDAGGEPPVEEDHHRPLSGDHLGAQPRRRRRRGNGEDVLRLRGAERADRAKSRGPPRSARHRGCLRDRRRGHPGRLPADLGVPVRAGPALAGEHLLHVQHRRHRHRLALRDVTAQLLLLLGDNGQGLLVEGSGHVLGPAPVGLIAGRAVIVGGTRRVSGFAPVVSQRGRDVADLAHGALEEAGDRAVALAPQRTRQRGVGDLANELVLERELLVSLETRDPIAADQVAAFE